MPFNIVTKEIEVGSVSFSVDGLQELIVELNEIIREQGELEIAAAQKRDDQTEEEFLAHLQRARENAFHCLMTISYVDGSSLITHRAEDISVKFNSPLIKSVYISNSTPYHQFTGTEPHHQFAILIDFSVPKLFDPTTILSNKTENSTFIKIEGNRGPWRAGVEQAVRKQIGKSHRARSFMHRPFIYDLGLMVIGLPLAFYLMVQFGDLITAMFGNTHAVVIGAVYVYVGLLAIWLYRTAFSYTKWAFPVVELTDQATRPKKHRRIWWTAFTALAAKLAWDFFDLVIY